MANDGSSGSERIIRYEMVSNAPTGEGLQYVTDHGRVWSPLTGVNAAAPPSTGESRGTKIGDVIYPK